MRQRIISLLSVLAVMAGIIVVSESAQSVSVEPETADLPESVGGGEEEAQEEIQEKEIQEERHQEDAGGIFADSAVVDLGNHNVAYLTTSDGLERDYGYEDWIVFQKLDQGSGAWDDKTLYIPAEGTITAIAADDFNIQITAKAGQEICDIQIPICFMSETDCVELLPYDKLAVLSAQPEASSLPETVWTEEIGMDEKYEVSFERISVPYTPVSTLMGGKHADYRLTVRDADGNALQELILKNFFILYEDIYWKIDVDGNGFLDFVFCTYFFCGQENSNTTLEFLIWNNDKKMYEEKPFPKTDLEWPTWNTQERKLMFTTEELGNYWVRGQEMYCFDDGDWQLYARLIPSSDEEPPRGMNGYEKESYYKELDYYYIERRYKAGKVIGETILEEAPYWDEESMWNDERKGNQELFPEGKGPLGIDWTEP